MDSIILLGQKNTLAEYMILSSANNRPPMLDKDLYVSWKSRMKLYMQNREHGRMILESVENGPLIWPTVEENGVTRTMKYAKLSTADQIQTDYDLKETNIILEGDDPIACLNKAMAFLAAVASSRGNNVSRQTRVVKCYNCQGEGHMARQCTQPKQLRNVAWYKDKAMLAEAREVGQVLDEEKLAFLTDPGVPDGQAVRLSFQTMLLFRLRILILMILTVMISQMQKRFSWSIFPTMILTSKTYPSDMENQSVHAMQDFKQSQVVDFLDNEINSYSNIIPYSQYLQETQ
nr:hypothetical protein [Tanacetum cinerariifolium]